MTEEATSGQTMTRPPIIEMEGVSKHFGSFQALAFSTWRRRRTRP